MEEGLGAEGWKGGCTLVGAVDEEGCLTGGIWGGRRNVVSMSES